MPAQNCDFKLFLNIFFFHVVENKILNKMVQKYILFLHQVMFKIKIQDKKIKLFGIRKRSDHGILPYCLIKNDFKFFLWICLQFLI